MRVWPKDEKAQEHIRHALMLLDAALPTGEGHYVLSVDDAEALRARLWQAVRLLETRPVDAILPTTPLTR